MWSSEVNLSRGITFSQTTDENTDSSDGIQGCTAVFLQAVLMHTASICVTTHDLCKHVVGYINYLRI